MRNLNNLATFVQVAKYESVTKASAKLHLTQQAVSYQVKKLEQELGVRLFKRAHRKIYLTPEGKALLQTAEQHLSALERDVFHVKYDQSVLLGHIKVGITMELASLVLAPIVTCFKKLYPQVSIELALQDDAATVDQIIHGDTDLGVVVFSSELPLLQITPLKKERFVTLASAEYFEEHRPFISFRDVIERDIVDFAPGCPSMKTWLSKNDKSLLKKLEATPASVAANDDRVIKQFVMAGLGVANVPRTLFEEELQRGSAVEILPQSKSISAGIDLIYMKDRVLPRHIVAFIEHVNSAIKEAE